MYVEGSRKKKRIILLEFPKKFATQNCKRVVSSLAALCFSHLKVFAPIIFYKDSSVHWQVHLLKGAKFCILKRNARTAAPFVPCSSSLCIQSDGGKRQGVGKNSTT